MLRLSLDLGAHVLMASMSGGQSSPEHQRVYDAIEMLDRSGRERGRAIALVFIVARDNPAPDADWRRRFADQRKTFGSPHVYLSIVTRSAIMRGVLTAMNWISPQPANMTSLTHATFEESAEWVEHVQGTSRIALRKLRESMESSSGERERAIS